MTMGFTNLPDHPFSEQELFAVMRLFLSDGEARDVAAEMMKGVTLSGETVDRAHDPTSLSMSDFSFDTLVLLSLLSDDTRRKVEDWRNRFGEPTEAEKQRWQVRRQELALWAKEGYRRLDE